MPEVATNLIGQVVSWYSDRGKEGGIVVAVSHDRGLYYLLVNVDGKLVAKDHSTVRVE
jgi:hypothetical protein